MKNSKRLWAAALALAITLTALSGCGGGASSSGAPSGSGSSGSSSQTGQTAPMDLSAVTDPYQSKVLFCSLGWLGTHVPQVGLDLRGILLP